MKYTLLAVLAISIVACTTPQSSNRSVNGSPLYHRLYQGYLVNRQTPKHEFEQNINKNFLPLFIQAHGVGLVSYRPALPKKVNGCELPEEIALLSFESKDVYDNVYSKAPIRNEVVAAHSIFDSATSKSLVPEPFIGIVKENVAYNVNPSFVNFTGSHSMAIVHCALGIQREALVNEVQKAYASDSGADNIIFVMAPNHIVEYVFFDKPEKLKSLRDERRKKLGSIFKKSTTIELSKQKIGAAPVSVGQGIDAQWD